MAKKKKHHRKKSVYRQQPRPAQGAAQSSTKDVHVAAGADTSAKAPLSSTPQAIKPDKKPQQAMGSDADAKRSIREVRHSLILAGSIFIGLAALWALFSFTKLGPAIYSSFKF